MFGQGTPQKLCMLCEVPLITRSVEFVQLLEEQKMDKERAMPEQ